MTRSAQPFGADSLLWEMIGDRRFLLVFPGALIMQVMHPAVGSAVGDQSVYRSDPWGRAQRSLDSVMLWVYGGHDALDEGERLRRLHRSIEGVDLNGDAYHANDREPYTWVHATAFERMVTFRRIFGVPLTQAEEDQLYDEHLQLGAILRIPRDHMPPDRVGYWDYFHTMVATRLVNHPTAHDVLRALRHAQAPLFIPPRLHRVWFPLGETGGRLGRWLSVATLPDDVRRILGVEWTATDERRLRAVAVAVRSIAPGLPERLRYDPYAYRAILLERQHRRVVGRASPADRHDPVAPR